MTRISAGIAPFELCDSQLLAEHREIIRIPNTIKSGKAKVNIDKIPNEFKLGSGHVIFFYNKLEYLRNRYIALHKECCKREFNVQNYSKVFKHLPPDLCNDWNPDDEVRKIVQERINNRLLKMKTIRYFGQKVDIDFLQYLAEIRR